MDDNRDGAGPRERLRLPDGRGLSYACFGRPGGIPVLHFHGGLSSRWEGAVYHEHALAAGLRLVSIDRPGIGGSSMEPARTVSSWPADVECLLRHLELPSASLLAVSGGATYALACARALPEFIRTVTIVAGLVDVASPENRQRLAPPTRGLYGLLRESPALLRGALLPAAVAMHVPGARAGVRGWLRLVGRFIGGLSPSDRQAITHPRFQSLLESLPGEAFRAPYSGLGAGAAHDVQLLMQPWTTALSEIEQPVHLWYGDADRVTPGWMGEVLAGQLKRSVLRIVPGQGHLSLLFGEIDNILHTLAGAHRAALEPARAPDPITV